MIWIAFAIMMAIAVAFATVPLLVSRRISPERDVRAHCYERQLAEIEREAEEGAISQSEADALKTEAGRRLIAASKAQSMMENKMQNPRPVAAVAIAAIVAAASVSLYVIKGSPQAPSVHPSTSASVREVAATPPQSKIGSVDSMIEGLKSRLAAEPGNVDDWRMLGWSYFNLGRHRESADAYAKAVELRPDDAGIQSAYGEALVMAAAGFVTPASINAFDAALAEEANDPRARFFKALALDQAGDHEAAIDGWIDLANSAEPGADWLDGLVRRIKVRAAEIGVDVSGSLKAREALSVSSAFFKSPSQEQIESAQSMPANEQQVMIEGMVERLAARLRENPDDADGWIRLIKSRIVLGAKADAERDLNSALAAFADRPEIRSRIAAEAEAIGVNVD